MAREISQTDFRSEVLENEKPVLVDFWAPWCGPCRAIAPALNELSQEQNEFEVIKINIDENPEIAGHYRIQSIPAMMVFKDGKVVANRVGGLPKAQILSWVKENI
ncbi:thioredoxin [Candidatus Deianiraea vastatrix]|uniref:Thioredoxin n=1 Tax=Candidatus Deianiraea vastatrix TaxID=2163644 RepID=A0A5B8XEA9_9RICK|nr:thioredoxin [Candidatus Deianiraea vastatrix]QED23215.1 Thioredoxin C-1 [Candidatus Deianiraea vastatrix]